MFEERRRIIMRLWNLWASIGLGIILVFIFARVVKPRVEERRSSATSVSIGIENSISGDVVVSRDVSTSINSF